MYNATEQFAEFNKANVAQATQARRDLARERREARSSSTSTPPRSCSRRASKARKPSPSVKDVQELFALRAKFAETGVQTATGYSRTSTNSPRKRKPSTRPFAEEAWSAYTKGVAAWVDKASKSAPAGSDVGLNAFKSTFAATTAAFDQFQKATKQVVSLADANVPRRVRASDQDRQGQEGRRQVKKGASTAPRDARRCFSPPARGRTGDLEADLKKPPAVPTLLGVVSFCINTPPPD